MKFKSLKIGLSALILTISGFANANLIEHITNGDFETGDFSGWNVVNTGSGDWVINDGTFDPIGSGTALSPISGNYDALSHQSGGGFHNLYQDITLPNYFASATLSWDDRIRNHASVFSDPNQEWRVLIEDTSGVLISEIFSTEPGDTLIQSGPNSYSFDLTTLLQPMFGQTVRVSFEQQDNLYHFNASLDNVSLTTVPEPSTLAIFALGIMGLASRRFKK